MAGKKQGRLSSLAVASPTGGAFVELLALRDGTLNLSKAVIGSTTRDDGVWEAKLQGRKSGTLDASCAWNVSDAGLISAIDAYFNDTIVDVRWRMATETGERTYTAQATVHEPVLSGPNDDLGTVDLTFEITGPVTESTQ